MIFLKRLPRLYVRLFFFASAIALLLGNPKLLVQSSPFIAVCSSIAGRSLAAGSMIGLAFTLAVLLHSRWFCRYACPVGLFLEGTFRIGMKRTAWWSRCPQIGRYAALLTLAGAVAGYPVLLWMDPLSIFSGAFAVKVKPADILSGIPAGILILLSLSSGNLWCSRLCPLGGVQDLLSSLRFRIRETGRQPRPAGDFQARRAFLFGAAGVGLGIWARRTGAVQPDDAPLRPPGAIADERFPGVCARCGNCTRACPSGIIHPDVGDAGFAGLMAPVIRYERNYCLEECVECTRVCPSGALQPLSLKQKRAYAIGEALVDGSLCLVVLGEKDCDACARSCPYDAVRIYWDEDRYIAYPLVDFKKCNGCGACEVSCPTKGYKAIRVWKKLRSTNDELQN